MNIDITPRTHHDDDVTLALKIEVSSISGTGFGGLPTFGNREINTVIRLRDGETNMLAGLIRDDERHVARRDSRAERPARSSAGCSPTTQKQTEQTDIILTLTPHIIRVLDLTEADLRPFRVGRDSLAPDRRPAACRSSRRRSRPTPEPRRPGRAPDAPRPGRRRRRRIDAASRLTLDPPRPQPARLRAAPEPRPQP